MKQIRTGINRALVQNLFFDDKRKWIGPRTLKTCLIEHLLKTKRQNITEAAALATASLIWESLDGQTLLQLHKTFLHQTDPASDDELFQREIDLVALAVTQARTLVEDMLAAAHQEQRIIPFARDRHLIRAAAAARLQSDRLIDMLRPCLHLLKSLYF